MRDERNAGGFVYTITAVCYRRTTGAEDVGIMTAWWSGCGGAMSLALLAKGYS